MTGATGSPAATLTPVAGYGPGDLRSAYALGDLSSTAGGGQTLAIVDAYDDPTAEVDLAAYRAQYGLTPCTSASGCFRKVNQRGTLLYPAADAAWTQEISLDLDMASAVCPNCRILLVEADSTNLDDLARAVDEAASLGATQISNSYGGPEYGGETTDEAHYNHPGVAITASTGDGGYGVEFPAASRYVTAVGGTTLLRDSTSPSGWTEAAWASAGSGCSAYIAKPAWQTDPACAQRSVADVAAVADPQTGVAVYDSYPFQGSAGWMVFGGTSVAAPIVAGFDALLGSGASSASYLYAHSRSLIDIVSGATGTCPVFYLCNAGPTYDGPTGLGSINGAPPASLPGATTGTATAIGDTTATATGLINPAGTTTSVQFLYGPSTAYGSRTPQQAVGSDTTNHPVSAALTGLAPATSYHIRIVATDACGCRDNTSYGADAIFTTTAAAPPAPNPTPTPTTGSTTSTTPTTGIPAGPVATSTPTAPTTPQPPVSSVPAAAAPPATAIIRLAETRRPASLKIRKASISAGHLHVLADITRLADVGAIQITFRANRQTIHLTAFVAGGRMRITHTLPAVQQHATTGRLTLDYAGNPEVRPARLRVTVTARTPLRVASSD